MAKLVLLHKSESIYEDRLAEVYDFPRTYLTTIQSGVGDWAIYYEPVKAGPRGYFAVAKIQEVIEKPGTPGRYLALIAPNSYLLFDQPVARLFEGSPLEKALRNPDGSPKSGGVVQRAVRSLSEEEFARIVDLGLPADLIEQEQYRYDPPEAQRGVFAEPVAPFDRPVVERLTRRPYRDVAFRRRVRAAYDYRCAMSGLRLRNGGGRPEVQAAHIRPVEEKGSDAPNNGLALSGTLHWMFDRGLISVAEDCRTILISHNKVPEDVVQRLIHPNRQLIPPVDPWDAPHPDNLRWHRENRFGQVLGSEEIAWDT